jgi:hypothetical protein
MTVIFKSALVLAFGPLVFAGPPDLQVLDAPARAAIEQAVLETSARMTEAGQALDADRLFSFMLDTDKGSVIQNGRLMLTRREALERIRNGFRSLRRVEYRWKRQYVSVASPTVAILVAEGESSATTEEGQTFTIPFTQTVVFVLTEGQWKALHAHHSSPRGQ